MRSCTSVAPQSHCASAEIGTTSFIVDSADINMLDSARTELQSCKNPHSDRISLH